MQEYASNAVELGAKVPTYVCAHVPDWLAAVLRKIITGVTPQRQCRELPAALLEWAAACCCCLLVS
jgi:hypothetical protein